MVIAYHCHSPSLPGEQCCFPVAAWNVMLLLLWWLMEHMLMCSRVWSFSVFICTMITTSRRNPHKWKLFSNAESLRGFGAWNARCGVGGGWTGCSLMTAWGWVYAEGSKEPPHASVGVWAHVTHTWHNGCVMKTARADVWWRASGRLCWRKGSRWVAVAGIQERDGGGPGVAHGSERGSEVNGIERYLGGRISKTFRQDFSG